MVSQREYKKQDEEIIFSLENWSGFLEFWCIDPEADCGVFRENSLKAKDLPGIIDESTSLTFEVYAKNGVVTYHISVNKKEFKAASFRLI